MEGARKARSEFFLVVSGREARVREAQKAVFDVRNRKSAMADARKPNIGQLRFSRIEHRPCSMFSNRTSAMFDFSKSKIRHVRFSQIENR